MKIYKIAKNNKKSEKKEYSWVYINLPKDMKDKLLELGELIDPEDRYVEECDGGLEKDPHVTVKYGLLTNDVKDIKGRLKEEKGGTVYLGKSSVFKGEEYDVVKITVESKDLCRIHSRLNELKHEDNFPDYQAHATIAYVKSGKGKKYNGKFILNKRCKFEEVYFGDLNRKDHKVKLK